MYLIKFSTDAETDADEAGEWYDEKSAELSIKFYEDVNKAILTIQKSPKLYPLHRHYKSIRRKNLSVFPYKIFYPVIDKTVFIKAILHHKRSTKFIKIRLK